MTYTQSEIPYVVMCFMSLFILMNIKRLLKKIKLPISDLMVIVILIENWNVLVIFSLYLLF